MPVTVRIPSIPNPLVSAAVMREVGDFALRLIRTRTEKGIDAEGKAFLPLSPAYAEQKAKALGHSRADLTVSGRMLNDMRVVGSGANKVTLGFISQGGQARGKQTFIQRSRAVGAADKAYWHHVSGAGRSGVRREFFAISDGEADLIRDRVARHLDTIVRNANRG